MSSLIADKLMKIHLNFSQVSHLMNSRYFWTSMNKEAVHSGNVFMRRYWNIKYVQPGIRDYLNKLNKIAHLLSDIVGGLLSPSPHWTSNLGRTVVQSQGKVLICWDISILIHHIHSNLFCSIQIKITVSGSAAHPVSPNQIFFQQPKPNSQASNIRHICAFIRFMADSTAFICLVITFICYHLLHVIRLL